MRQINEENLNGTGALLSTVNPSEMGKMFSYNGINVRMRKMNGYILVCLTDFARLFPDKNLSTIINSKEMTDYVNRLSEIKNFISTDLLQIIKGGNVSQQGTWAHQKIALRVAQKLSTDFAIWVDDKIEEFLPREILLYHQDFQTSTILPKLLGLGLMSMKGIKH